MPRHLSDLMDWDNLAGLGDFYGAFKSAAGATDPALAESYEEFVRACRADLAGMPVYNVRTARDRFSSILNDASSGEVTCIAAGDGEPVFVISATRLAEAMATIEERRGLTLADLVRKLPFAGADLPDVELTHREPTRGIADSLVEDEAVEPA